MLYLTSVMSFLPVIFIAIMVMFSIVLISSWSWTGETPKSHHYLFLLPYLPLCLAPISQFALFQHFVKPKTARQQWFAFLSLLIPVRVLLIKDFNKAYNYFLISCLNTHLSIILSWALLLVSMRCLPESEDPENKLFTLLIEILTPLILWACIQTFLASRLLWHTIIAPDLLTPHIYPDFEDPQERIATFPNYWNKKLNDILMAGVGVIDLTHREFSENLTEKQIHYLSKLALKKIKDENLNQDIESVVQEVDLRAEMSCFNLWEPDDQDVPTTLSFTKPFTVTLNKNIQHIQFMTWVNAMFSSVYFVKHGFFYSDPKMNRAEASYP